ncbi:MAG TPA: AAA family ATPase, partial [Ktedonobacterales bacterium]
MYLKRLELQGFKSFAPRTMLEFSPGITAIVGPNGSGKSNIADAIRWVLGEQSMRQLRGKKSDDVIFAGGHGRAQMQMAEVSLVLDNSASWLPSEHTEVTGTRRSFRSGESEYLINGQRVRLRDLLLLLAQARIGHDSYTVIGQGLVDQALSLRADERRGLFEDAAGIRQFQAQRTDAEQKLALTQSNLGRLRDILGEIEPRLGPLAEQAKRARDYSGVRDELKRLLRTWFAWQWEDALSKRTHADAAEAARAGRIQGVRERLTDLEGEAQRTREARDGLRERLAELRRARGEVTGRVQAQEQDLAVGQERIASLLRQAADIESEQGEQEVALAAAEAHASALDQQLTVTEREIAVAAAQLDALERSQHVAGQEQERAEAALRAAQRDVIQLQARLGAAQTESGRLQRQLGERNRALATRVEAVNASQRKLEAAQTSLRKRTTAFEAARREVEGVVGQREAVQRELAEGQSAIDEIRMAVADAERERRAIDDRLALLEEWRRGQDGYADGARALLQARAEDRPPALGALAQLIQVTAGYEVAVEAALGPLLTAVVAVSTTDALACARWLRERGAGYAQIVWPAEGGSSGRSMPDAEALILRADDHEELVPIARYLEIGAELQPMLDDLVKGLYLVPDLDTAHRLMSDLATSRQLGARRDHPTQPLRALITVGGEVRHVHQWLRGG